MVGWGWEWEGWRNINRDRRRRQNDGMRAKQNGKEGKRRAQSWSIRESSGTSWKWGQRVERRLRRLKKMLCVRSLSSLSVSPIKV